ncbi:MAG: hypothetical protein ACOYYS_10060 [Chloroflexota bacterium]
MNAFSFALHVFASILRQNPALPLKAATAEKAYAKMWAAGALLRTLCASEDSNRLLALEALDESTNYAYTHHAIDDAVNLAWGSRRKQAQDAGGYYGHAMRSAIRYQFVESERNVERSRNNGHGINNDVVYSDARAEIIVSAFPKTWTAICNIACPGDVTDENRQMMLTPILSIMKEAIEAEWEIAQALSDDDMMQLVRRAADAFAIPYDSEKPFESIQTRDYENCKFVFIQISRYDLIEHNKNLPAGNECFALPVPEDHFPPLHIERDQKWHFVASIRQVGCTSGIGWYKSYTYDEDTLLLGSDTLKKLESSDE